MSDDYELERIDIEGDEAQALVRQMTDTAEDVSQFIIAPLKRTVIDNDGATVSEVVVLGMCFGISYCEDCDEPHEEWRSVEFPWALFAKLAEEATRTVEAGRVR